MENSKHFKDSIMERIYSCELLCHYTSFQSAALILGSRTIRFSKPLRVNDINESSRRFFSTNPDQLDQCADIISRFRQISLTKDGDNRCYDIPAMWGHYAEKGDGACLLFDKQLLLSVFDHSYWYNPISYCRDSSQDIIFENCEKDSCILRYVELHKDMIFFQKTKDWSYEQEFRIVKYFDDENETTYISIPKNALISVILCCNGIDETDRFRPAKRQVFSRLSEAPVIFYEKKFMDGSHGLLFMDCEDNAFQMFQ